MEGKEQFTSPPTSIDPEEYKSEAKEFKVWNMELKDMSEKAIMDSMFVFSSVTFRACTWLVSLEDVTAPCQLEP